MSQKLKKIPRRILSWPRSSQPYKKVHWKSRVPFPLNIIQQLFFLINHRVISWPQWSDSWSIVFDFPSLPPAFSSILSSDLIWVKIASKYAESVKKFTINRVCSIAETEYIYIFFQKPKSIILRCIYTTDFKSLSRPLFKASRGLTSHQAWHSVLLFPRYSDMIGFSIVQCMHSCSVLHSRLSCYVLACFLALS